MPGAALGARFSLATNRLGYCGPADAEPALYGAAIGTAPEAPAAAALLKFEALGPYLRAIGAKHGLDPMDRRVVEAYWIGNDLLDAFDRDDFDAILEALVQRGLPRRIAVRLHAHLPDRPIPHHVFHVAFVGVGAVTGHVPTTLANMEACRPAWATVERVSPGSLRLRKPSLEVDDGRLRLGAPHELEVSYDPRLLPTVHPGSFVVLHWGLPVLELSPAELHALERYSRQSWAAANQVLPGLDVFGEGPA